MPPFAAAVTTVAAAVPQLDVQSEAVLPVSLQLTFAFADKGASNAFGCMKRWHMGMAPTESAMTLCIRLEPASCTSFTLSTHGALDQLCALMR